jgi:tRNA threonylcarbamoyladenosine biosynthesis protein TsaB
LTLCFEFLMLILAVDTSGKCGSIALARAPDQVPDASHSNGDIEVLELTPLQGGTFSAQLVPQISTVLTKHGMTKQDIGAFAVASGPGSFTGLRVGLAAIKALAEILGKPIATVSLLEAIVRSGKAQGRVISALDAGRGEVYAGEYEVGSRARMLSERLLTRAELTADARGRVVITPDPGLADLARKEGSIMEQIAAPRADAIARLGWEKIVAGETIAADDLEANYIRRSDAEIFAKGNH